MPFLKKTKALLLLLLAAVSLSSCGYEDARSAPSGADVYHTGYPSQEATIRLPSIENAHKVHIVRGQQDGPNFGWRYDLTYEELFSFLDAFVRIEINNPGNLDEIAAEPDSGELEQLYIVQVTCHETIPDVSGIVLVEYEYMIYPDNIIRMPDGELYEYEPQSFDTAVLDSLISNRPVITRSEDSISAAQEAFESWFEENFDDAGITKLWYDNKADNFWTDFAVHDSMGFHVDGKSEDDFIGLCFMYEPVNSGDSVPPKDAGKNCVVVMTQNAGEWEFYNYIQVE